MARQWPVDHASRSLAQVWLNASRRSHLRSAQTSLAHRYNVYSARPFAFRELLHTDAGEVSEPGRNHFLVRSLGWPIQLCGLSEMDTKEMTYKPQMNGSLNMDDLSDARAYFEKEYQHETALFNGSKIAAGQYRRYADAIAQAALMLVSLPAPPK